MTGLETAAMIQLFNLYICSCWDPAVFQVCVWGCRLGFPFLAQQWASGHAGFAGSQLFPFSILEYLLLFCSRASSCKVLVVSYSFHLSPLLWSLWTSCCSFLPWTERFMDCPSPKGWMSRKRNVSPPVPSSLEWAVVVKELLVLSRS